MTDASPAVIAVDGPAASGKGTIAQGVAQSLGFHYLDSGSLYRLVALKALETGVPLDAEARLAALAEGLASAFAEERMLLDGVGAKGQKEKASRPGATATRCYEITTR